MGRRIIRLPLLVVADVYTYARADACCMREREGDEASGAGERAKLRHDSLKAVDKLRIVRYDVCS
jgi:hypothetical protein